MKKIQNSFISLCHKAFYQTNSRLFVIVNDVLSIVIIFSILSIILESVPRFSQYHSLFSTIEHISVIIFSLEYILRIVGSPKKARYIFGFFGIIDLISILPTILGAANLLPLKSVRAIRILRFLRIMRLAKVTRLEKIKKPSKKDSGAIIKLDLQIYFLTILFTVIILGNMAYIFEHSHPHFESIPLSMLFVLESLLGGSISNIYPETYAGMIVFMITRFISFILLGFLIHIIGSIVSHVLFGTKKSGL